MELLKRTIHMNQVKCSSMVQLTLDDDFNVPDVKPDVEWIVKEQGYVVITDVVPMSGRFQIKGKLVFNLLYISEDRERPVHHITGEVPFEEIVNMDEIDGGETIAVKWELEDMTASLINSRKLNVRAILTLHFCAETGYEEETATGIEGEEGIQSKNKTIHITNAPIVKKDTLRVKDEVSLPLGKPNIEDLLYTNLELRNLELRLLGDKLSVKGDLEIFLLYAGESQEMPLDYWTVAVPVSSMLECSGCREDMIGDIGISVLSEDIAAKPDEDGEQRILDIEAVLELDIKLYEEEEIELLEDFYSTTQILLPVKKEAYYKNLLVKNSSKLRLSENIRLEQGQLPVLQVCNVSGSVKLDEEKFEENGIRVEGVLEVQVLYITEDDLRPVNSMKQSIPFEQLIEVKNIKPDSTFDIRPFVEQLSTLMVSADELEVKASLGLEAMVFDSLREEIITEIKEEGSLLDKLSGLPGLVGYIAGEKESLWDIAKAFNTTLESIMELNELETEAVKPGDKLLLMKQVDSIPLLQETPR